MTPTYDDRIKDIEYNAQYYRTVREFFKYHPYLYRWALKHNIDLKQYFPQQRKRLQKFYNRNNKGIDCYLVETGEFYKHYAFVVEALRELDLTYYYVKRVLNGEIESIDGYFFVRCT